MKLLRRAWLPLLVTAAVAWQFRAPLLGRVYFFEDISAYFAPLWSAAARQMKQGNFPSWELTGWSGLPLVGDPQIGVFYPFNWLWLAMKPLRVYAWLQLAHALWAAAGMWMLCAARGRSRIACALGALAFSLSAFFVLEARHSMFIASTAWLPWLLWAIERWVKQRRIEHLVAAAGSAGLALLAGGWSLLYFGAVVIAIVSIGRVFSVEKRDRVKVFAGLTAAALLAIALAAVQLGPALVHAKLSPRALGVEYDFASSYAWPSWRYLLALVFPSYFGDVARGTYTGADDQWELCGWGIGAVATLLVPLSLLDRERRRERIALLVACAIACDLARGAHGFLHPLFFRHVPLYASLRCPARALYIWTLSAPLLAADGLDTWLARLPSRRRALAGALAISLVAIELTVTWRAENPSVTLASTESEPDALMWLRHRKRARLTTDVHLGQRFHNGGLAWAYESAVGYSSLPIWRYLHLLYIANHGHVYPHARLADDLTAQGLWRFGSPLVDLLAVKWVLAPRDRPLGDAKYTRVFSGGDGIDVWRNDEVYPRGFVVHRAHVVANEAAAAQAIADEKFQPGQVAIVEHAIDGVPEPGAGETLPRPTEFLALWREGPDLALEVELAEPGILIVSEPWYPTWRATLDDRPVEILRADYALKGVVVPRGRHVIALELFDVPLMTGGAVSAVALTLLFGLLLAQQRRARRARMASG